MLEKVSVPTLAFLGEHDDAVIGDPRRALEVIRKKMKSAPSFEAKIIEGAPHSYFGREKQMTDEIIDWLNGHSK
jgi:dienelactone hydrolase